MKHDVTNLLFYLLHVSFEDGIREFVGFFDSEMTETFDGLLFIPWAIFPEFVHDGEQTIKSLKLYLTIQIGR
jgi:hypothetical protein